MAVGRAALCARADRLGAPPMIKPRRPTWISRSCGAPYENADGVRRSEQAVAVPSGGSPRAASTLTQPPYAIRESPAVVLGARYEPRLLLGSGAMADVHLAPTSGSTLTSCTDFRATAEGGPGVPCAGAAPKRYGNTSTTKPAAAYVVSLTYAADPRHEPCSGLQRRGCSSRVLTAWVSR